MTPAFEKILFFDIGGVLLTNGWDHQSRQAAAARFGFDYGEMNQLHDLVFNLYEMGRITLDEYLDTILFYQPRPFTKAAFQDFMFAQSAQLPVMLDWLIDWKQRQGGRFRFLAINNEGRELNAYRIRTFGLHRLFDAFISSCEVGMRKPDSGIFRLALGIAGVDPGSCLYFDDRPALATAAVKVGLQAYVHKSPAATQAILQNLL